MMKMKQSFVGINLVLVGLLCASSASAQLSDRDLNLEVGVDRDQLNSQIADTQVYPSWDTDKDGFLSNDEFRNSLLGNSKNGNRLGSANFDNFDVDGDGYLTDREFSDGMFSTYDVNNSGLLEREEYGYLGSDLDLRRE